MAGSSKEDSSNAGPPGDPPDDGKHTKRVVDESVQKDILCDDEEAQIPSSENVTANDEILDMDASEFESPGADTSNVHAQTLDGNKTMVFGEIPGRNGRNAAAAENSKVFGENDPILTSNQGATGAPSAKGVTKSTLNSNATMGSTILAQIPGM